MSKGLFPGQGAGPEQTPGGEGVLWESGWVQHSHPLTQPGSPPGSACADGISP